MKFTPSIAIILLLISSLSVQAQTKKTTKSDKTSTPAKKATIIKKTTTVKKTTTKPASTSKPAQAKKPELAPPMPPAPPPPVQQAMGKAKMGKPISFEGGITLAKSIRTFHLFQTVGIGLDGAARYSLPGALKDLSVGLRANYAYFFKNNAQLLGTPHGESIINVLVNAQYDLPYHIFAGGGLGLGLALSGSSSTVGFAKSIYAGYDLPLQQNSLALALFFGQAMAGTKNIGIRAALKF